jgi:HTH-type transcriptional regulator/antitoxin HipB
MPPYGDNAVGEDVEMRVSTIYQLGATARDRRVELGWTQTDVARRAGVSRKWVSDLETGRTHPDLAVVLRLFGALGLVIDVAVESAPSSVGDLDRLLERHQQR